MAKLLAIEWDAREARIAVAQSRGDEILLEDAFAVPLGASDPASDGGDIGQRITSALAARNVLKAEVLVGVGRANIELKQMALPPCPADELPDLVRFQAMRQFTSITSEWPLDYVPLQSDESGTNVLAAAIAPSMVEQIHATCATGDLTPKRLVLRPFAAASLLGRSDRTGQEPPRLMVDILTDEADLTVLAAKQVVLMRTVRLPSTEAALTKSMLGEIRRTIAAAQNQMQGQRIERIVLCGNGSDQSELKESIEKELSYDVTFFDPFEAVPLHRSLAERRPEHVGRFTPLIGMLLDESTGASHGIDFLHPRKKPKPPSQKRRNSLVGAFAGVLALAALLLIWLQLASRDAEIEGLTAESNGLKEDVIAANLRRNELTRINGFLAGDVTWLDKFYELCEELVSDPESEGATKPFLVTSVRMNTTEATGGGIIVVEGFSRETSEIELLRRKLRSRGFEVIPGGFSEDNNRPDFRWRFSDRYRVPPPGSEMATRT